jgi:hypothetical protein
MALPQQEVVAVGVAVEIGVGFCVVAGRGLPDGQILSVDDAVVVEVAWDAVRDDAGERARAAGQQKLQVEILAAGRVEEGAER